MKTFLLMTLEYLRMVALRILGYLGTVMLVLVYCALVIFIGLKSLGFALFVPENDVIFYVVVACMATVVVGVAAGLIGALAVIRLWDVCDL